MTAAYFNLRGRYRSLGRSFRILPTVLQPTSAEFIPQITFRISANYQHPENPPRLVPSICSSGGISTQQRLLPQRREKSCKMCARTRTRTRHLSRSRRACYQQTAQGLVTAASIALFMERRKQTSTWFSVSATPANGRLITRLNFCHSRFLLSNN